MGAVAGSYLTETIRWRGMPISTRRNRLRQHFLNRVGRHLVSRIVPTRIRPKLPGRPPIWSVNSRKRLRRRCDRPVQPAVPGRLNPIVIEPPPFGDFLTAILVCRRRSSRRVTCSSASHSWSGDVVRVGEGDSARNALTAFSVCRTDQSRAIRRSIIANWSNEVDKLSNALAWPSVIIPLASACLTRSGADNNLKGVGNSHPGPTNPVGHFLLGEPEIFD